LFSFNLEFERDATDETRRAMSDPLDEGIDNTFVSLGGVSGLRRRLSGRFGETDTKVLWTFAYMVAHPQNFLLVFNRCFAVF
jgi:hypothetical protein